MARNRLHLPRLSKRAPAELRRFAEDIDSVFSRVEESLSNFQSADTETVGGEPAGRLVGASRAPTQNLLGPDAGPEAENKIYTIELDEAGLQIGERISASFDLRTKAEGEVYIIELRFVDAEGAQISAAQGTTQQGTSYARVKVEDVAIPEGTTAIRLLADNVEPSFQGYYTRRAMLNRGPYALPFEEPPIRSQRETLKDIRDDDIYAKTTLNEKVGAGRAYDGLDEGGFVKAGKVGVDAIQLGAVIAEKIADGALTTAKFAQGVRPYLVVDELPADGSDTPLVFLTTDGKMYRWVNGEWEKRIPTVDLEGVIESVQLAQNAVTEQHIADLAVTLDKIADEAVNAQKLANQAVTNAKLATNSVDVTKIVDGAVTNAKLASNAVTNEKLANNAVTAAKIAAADRMSLMTPNLVSNGDAELGSKFNFSGVGGVVEVPDAPSGKYVFEHTSGAVTIFSDEYIPVDVDLPYRLSAFARYTSANAPRMYLGLAPYDAQQRLIQIGNVYSPDNIKRTLTANANAGATVVTLDDVSGIASDSNARLALGAQDDDSDLPNFNIYTITNVDAVTKQVTLGSPLRESYAAGTKARYHRGGGGHMYSGANNVLLTRQFRQFSGLIQGVQPITTSSDFTKFRIGTKYVRIVLLLNRDAGVETTQFDDVEFSIAVDATRVMDSAITTPKLAAGAVVADKIAANAVTAEKLAANAVTAQKLAAGAVQAGHIAAGAVETEKLAAGSVVTDKLATNAVTAEKIQAGAVESEKIATGAVVADKIAAGAVVADKIGAGAVTTAKLDALAVTADKIGANAVNSEKIAADSIDSGHIKALAVTTEKLAAGAVTADKLAANSVEAGKVQAGAIGTDQLAARAVTIEKLFVGSFDNLASNPSFETGDMGNHNVVNAGGSWSVTTTNPRSGLYAARYNPATQTGTARIDVNGILTDPNKHHTVSEGMSVYGEVWVRAENEGNANQVRVRLDFRDANGTSVATYLGALVTPTTTYQRVSHSRAAPAGAVYVALRIEIQNTGHNNPLLFDDIYLRVMVGGTLIEDGAITTNKLAANSVVAGKIAAGAVSTDKLAANAVTADKIAAGAVTAQKIAAGAVTTAKLANPVSDRGIVLDGSVPGGFNHYLNLADATKPIFKAGDVRIDWDGTAYLREIKAGVISRSQQGVFLETFEGDLSDWQVVYNGGGSIVSGSGLAGGKVYSSSAYEWRQFKHNIPFDSRALYRMTVRVKRAVANIQGSFYAGVAGVAADGVTLVNVSGANSTSGQHYICAQLVSQSTWATGEWMELTGWFMGHGAYKPNANDPRDPSGLHADVRYFRPVFIVNYNTGTDTIHIDEIRIEAFDEDGQLRVYQALGQGGSLNPNVRQASKVLAKGLIEWEGRHGDVIEFPPGFFASTPIISKPRGGLTYAPGALGWSPSFDANKGQYRRDEFLDLDAEGFTLVTQLYQKTATTNLHTYDGGSFLLDAVGETLTSPALELFTGSPTPPAYDNKYYVRYRATVGSGFDPLKPWIPYWTEMVVVFESSIDGGETWVPREQRTYRYSGNDEFAAGTISIDETLSFAVSGMGPGDKVRLRIASINYAGDSPTAKVEPSPSSSYDFWYYTQTGTENTISTTPDADDRVVGTAMEATV